MISVSEISKSFREKGVLLGFSCEFSDRSFISILGPSGCGKSTLLNIISGLDTPDSGAVHRHGSNGPIGYMMQEPHLLPWRNLSENSMLGVEVQKITHRSGGLLIKYLKAFELEQHADSYPAESSGGMKQRAALIRTLLTEPDILLLDEPFASLDFDIKLKVQREILEYHQHSEATTILVTHDIDDAIALSDKVLVLSDVPARIKAEVTIDLGISNRDPVEARKSPKFRDYFVKIWDELKYLGGKDGN